MSEGERETKRIFCNCCKGETHHLLRAMYSRARKIALDDNGLPLDPPDVFDVANSEEYKTYDVGEIRTSIWSCAGCDEETFEWRYTPADGDDVTSRYFPERRWNSEILPAKLFHKLTPELAKLYREIITAFNEGCSLLCAIGLRALLEGVCADKGLTDGNLEHKIERLSTFIPNLTLVEKLHAFRFAGNAAAHELEPLALDDARAAIEVMEDLLNFLYELDYKASLMKHASGRPASKLPAVKAAKLGLVH